MTSEERMNKASIQCTASTSSWGKQPDHKQDFKLVVEWKPQSDEGIGKYFKDVED